LTIEKISKLPREIKSCKFNYATSRSIAVDQEKFFIDIGPTQAGFDGKHFWSKDQRRPTSRIEKNSFLPFKELDMHPLNAPYIWVWGEPEAASWSDLRKDETWKSVANRMSYKARQTVHNQTCDVFVVNYPETNKKYTVAFSRSLGGFPVQISLEIENKPFSTADVLETHRVGNAVIATRGQARNNFSAERKEWIAIDVDSISVNQPVDVVIFQP
jgi:hypothetical protein